MGISDLIQEKLRAFPESLQREVLDFVEFLDRKHRQEETQWSEFSVETALRGMEEDTWPEFTEHDLKEKW